MPIKKLPIKSALISSMQYSSPPLTWVRVMMYNITFNNISAISWWSVLLVEETGVPRENHLPVASH